MNNNASKILEGEWLKLSVSAYVGTTVSMILLLFVTGCASSESAKLPTHMHPARLYLNDQPYRHIYVEVDIVEGTTLPDGYIEAVRRFLETHCHKPEGITIVQNEPIPISRFDGIPKIWAPLLCIDGPKRWNRQSAYIHILCYDSDQGHWKDAKFHHNPHAIIEGSQISMNLGYAYSGFEHYFLQHELGHILGLCKNPRHGDGAHCSNHGCLMEASPTIMNRAKTTFNGTPKGELCFDCLNDLQLGRDELAGNVYFEGPFMVREEASYAILMLGGALQILVPNEQLDTFKWEDYLNHIPKGIIPALRSSGMPWEHGSRLFLFLHSSKNLESLQTAFSDAAENDPDPYIRKKAAEELSKMKSRIPQ